MSFKNKFDTCKWRKPIASHSKYHYTGNNIHCLESQNFLIGNMKLTCYGVSKRQLYFILLKNNNKTRCSLIPKGYQSKKNH